MQAALKSPMGRLIAPLLLGLLIATSSEAAAPALASSKLPSPAARPVDFAKDIQPILENNCYECHGPEKQKGGLRLDQKATALQGGETGPLLVAGKSAESLIILALTGTKDGLAQMPKKRDPLPADQIGLLRAWIDQGAAWPEAASGHGKDWRTHWAFKALPQIVVEDAIESRLEGLTFRSSWQNRNLPQRQDLPTQAIRQDRRNPREPKGSPTSTTTRWPLSFPLGPFTDCLQ